MIEARWHAVMHPRPGPASAGAAAASDCATVGRFFLPPKGHKYKRTVLSAAEKPAKLC
jgi:hypothetical protein